MDAAMQDGVMTEEEQLAKVLEMSKNMN